MSKLLKILLIRNPSYFHRALLKDLYKIIAIDNPYAFLDNFFYQ